MIIVLQCQIQLLFAECCHLSVNVLLYEEPFIEQDPCCILIRARLLSVQDLRHLCSCQDLGLLPACAGLMLLPASIWPS